jgi:excisionase family DNA binding protein
MSNQTFEVRMTPVPKYLNKSQVADMLGVSHRTIDDWMKRRLIPFLKIGKAVRFVPADIEKHLTEKCKIG